MKLLNIFKLSSREIAARGIFLSALALTLVLGGMTGCAHLGSGNSIASQHEDALRAELDKAACGSTVLPLDQQKVLAGFGLTFEDLIKARVQKTQIDSKDFAAQIRPVLSKAIIDAAKKNHVNRNAISQILDRLYTDNRTIQFLLNKIFDESESAIPIPDSPIKFIVLKNASNLFAPSILNSYEYGELTGIRNFDEILGKSFAEKDQIFTILHEYNHCGDKQLELLFRQLVYYRTIPSSKNDLVDSEIRADVQALDAVYRVLGDKDFLRTEASIRMLFAYHEKDIGHLTTFEIGRILNQIDPQGDQIPHIPSDKIAVAMKALNETLSGIRVSPEEMAPFDDCPQMRWWTPTITKISKALNKDLLPDQQQRDMARTLVMAYNHCRKIVEAYNEKHNKPKPPNKILSFLKNAFWRHPALGGGATA